MSEDAPKYPGRPTVVTPEVVGKLEQAFAIDATVTEACGYANISRDAYYEYLKRNPLFADRVEELRNKPILKARQTVVNKLGDSYGNAINYLERKRRDEFAPSQKVEVEGKLTISSVLDEIENGGSTAGGQEVAHEQPVPDQGQEQQAGQVQAQ